MSVIIILVLYIPIRHDIFQINDNLISNVMKISSLVFTTFVFSSLAVAPAYAYLDPGTGSMIIQGILAGLAMAAMGIKMFWSRLVNFFNRIFNKNKSNTSENEDV